MADLFTHSQARAPALPGACSKCAGSGRFVSWTGRDCGECFACKGKGIVAAQSAPVALQAGSVDRLMVCFDKATSAGLKRPAMRFDGWTATLAPIKGKNPGAVYCKARGNDDGGLYLGKIVAGQFHASRDCEPAHKAAIALAMKDPLEAAVAYGRRTGACSCCGRTLTDPVSVADGIGPICKAKFGL